MINAISSRWGLRQILSLLLLAVGSLLGNIWAPQLFTGFNYLLGSIGVMLILRLFGIVPALFVALLAAAWCNQLFGHFYPLFWLGAEPIFVWLWLKRRPKDTMIKADTAYWIVFGVPLLFFFFLSALHVSLLETVAAGLMYTAIGVTNALLATLILNQFSIDQLVWPNRTVAPVTVAQLIFQALMLAIVLPAFLVLALTGRGRESDVRAALFDSLDIKARQVGSEVRRKIFDGFYPTKTDAEQLAKLDLDAIAKVLKGLQSNPAMQLHLMVNKGDVVASTNPQIASLSYYDPLAYAQIKPVNREQLYHRMPSDNPPVPLWQRVGKSSYIRIYHFPGTAFYAIAETTFAPYQTKIIEGHRNALALLLLYLVAGSFLATLVARRIATPLEQLSRATTDLPGRLMTEDLVWPESHITEISQLVENSQCMAHTLGGQFREVAQINADLEDRVTERTRELMGTNQTLREEVDERIRAERQRDHLMGELTIQLKFLQTLMDAIPDPIYFKDLEGRFQGFNQAFGQALGVSRDKLIGKTDDVLYGVDAAAYYRDKDRQLFAEGGVQRFETDLVYADHKSHAIIVNKATYHSPSGNLSGLIGIFIDITERKQAEQERGRLMRELETKNKELESIIYVSSHDLRSPLVNIQGFSRKLAKGCASLTKTLTELELPLENRAELQQLLTESMPRSIEFITGSVEKMDSLLSGLLRLSRLGRAAITIENLDMNLLMGTITNCLAFQVESTGAQIFVDDLLPCQGDAVQISQVFTNLLDNAIKYRMPERALEVRISSAICADGIQYCVRDNGIGIPADYQEQVWEIFNRINPRDIPGEGLGLTASRRILDRLNGAIWLESEEGVGSSFFVRLPAQQ